MIGKRAWKAIWLSPAGITHCVEGIFCRFWGRPVTSGAAHAFTIDTLQILGQSWWTCRNCRQFPTKGNVLKCIYSSLLQFFKECGHLSATYPSFGDLLTKQTVRWVSEVWSVYAQKWRVYTLSFERRGGVGGYHISGASIRRRPSLLLEIVSCSVVWTCFISDLNSICTQFSSCESKFHLFFVHVCVCFVKTHIFIMK